MKQALFFAFGVTVGALGLLPMLRAEAAPVVDKYEFSVVSISSGARDTGVEGALAGYGNLGYQVAGVLGNQVILQKKR
jgi:hypothetical protein